MLSVTVQDALVATLTENTFPLLDASRGYAPQATDVWLDMANVPTTRTARRPPDREAGSTTDERANATNEPTNATTHHANERPDLRTGEPGHQHDDPAYRRADEPADPRGEVTPTAALTADHQAHEQAYQHADAPPDRRGNSAPTTTPTAHQGPHRPRATEDSWSRRAVASSGSPGLAQAATPRQTGWAPTPTNAPTPGAYSECGAALGHVTGATALTTGPSVEGSVAAPACGGGKGSADYIYIYIYIYLQADATAADPMVDGRMFRGSDAWRLLASLQGSLPESEGSGKGRGGPNPWP